MAPPESSFPPSELQHHINKLPNGKRRKDEDIDLKKCDLVELVQYDCPLAKDPKTGETVIRCSPVVKLFRRWVYNFRIVCVLIGLDIARCAGGPMVETTLLKDAESNAAGATT